MLRTNLSSQHILRDVLLSMDGKLARVFYCSLFAANLCTFHTHTHIVSEAQRKPKHKKNAALNMILLLLQSGFAYNLMSCNDEKRNRLSAVHDFKLAPEFMF